MSAPVRLGAGMLVNVISVDAEDLPDFEDWYSFEHFPERLAVPGFERGRRFVETAPEPASRPVEFFSFYETAEMATLTSEPYLRALDTPTEWTRRIAGAFRGNERAVGRVTASEGVGTSGRVAVLRLSPVEGREGELREALQAAIARAVDDRAVLGGFLVEGDGGATAAKDATAEGRSMAGSSSGAHWYAVLEVHGVEVRLEGDRLRELLATPQVEAAAEELRLREYRLVSEAS
ncbi:hypothetical protein [Homoserinibacter sp. YIM 151385]|uniref:hypothetical protein n=1 Tax=Homoserinibacter sp. YIM 151385 TaxID=2985506 RepID=UPI0022F11E5C|nr:hypothetical protein [Homoserinibacter sp. YIM 151385]WBU37903.1 hypothetical protein OF852_13450 [Homoserinibacter sp. YIM 151385]